MFNQLNIPGGSVLGKLGSSNGEAEAILISQLAAALGIGSGPFILSSVAGTANAITATNSSITAYDTNTIVVFQAALNNTGATTLNINSLGAKSVTKLGTSALNANDIIAGAVCVAVYDGTQFELINPASISTSYAPLASPAFTGNPTGPTASQFDNDTSLATTAFVQRALGNRNNADSYNANQTLTASQAGRTIYFTGSTASQTLTLPAASGLLVGSGFHFVNQASVNVTIARAGSDTLTTLSLGGGTASGTSRVLQPGDSLWLESDGTSVWNEGNIPAGGMTNSLAASGYQKLPGGLIIQWGTFTTSGAGYSALTFPLTWPNALLQIVGVVNGGTATPYIVEFTFGSATTTTIPVAALTTASAYSAQAVMWIAVGH